MDLTDKIKTIPTSTGVYMFRDAGARVLYVGKAKNLRSRVRSYFSPTAVEPKVLALREQAVDVEFTVTGTEVEALLLESQLIKKHRPRFNVMLKDDKEYPYIRLAVAEEFPRLEVVRKMKRDKARYFGPYPNAGVVNDTMRLAKKLFPLRSCNDWRGKKRPCLNFHIRRCLAPCSGSVGVDEYHRLLEQVVLFLEGRHQQLENKLREQMEEASRQQEFERAAELRDQLDALAKLTTSQRIVSSQQWNLDVVAVAVSSRLAAAQLLTVRGGRVLGNDYFTFDTHRDSEPGELIGAFIRDHYQQVPVLPREILVDNLPDDSQALERWLSEKRSAPTVLRVPRRGEKRQLLNLARDNLAAHMEADVREQEQAREQSQAVLSLLARELELPRQPERMECYDISHIQGSQTVGSMVVFEHGRPARSKYRRFRVRGLAAPDDFAAMAQVIQRRFAAAREGREGFDSLPDLVVIDGGKGQLSAAAAKLAELGYNDVSVVALAKREEELYLPGRAEPVVLERGNPALRLLQQIRDEAHRFAISYHRRLREKETLASDLDQVPGVGPGRRQKLLQAFGSIHQLREKDVAEIAAVPGIPWSVAEAVHRHFRKSK